MAHGAKGSKHPGFKGAAEEIARKEGLPLERAKAIVASKTRGASAAAKRANPNLRHVRGA